MVWWVHVGWPCADSKAYGPCYTPLASTSDSSKNKTSKTTTKSLNQDFSFQRQPHRSSRLRLPPASTAAPPAAGERHCFPGRRPSTTAGSRLVLPVFYAPARPLPLPPGARCRVSANPCLLAPLPAAHTSKLAAGLPALPTPAGQLTPSFRRVAARGRPLHARAAARR